MIERFPVVFLQTEERSLPVPLMAMRSRFLSFALGGEIASIDSAAALPDDEDRFGYEATYLDAHHLVATTQEGRLLLIKRAKMQSAGWIVDSNGGVTSVRPHNSGRLLIAIDEHHLRLLDLSGSIAG